MKIPIHKVAQLANIQLSSEEEKSLAEDLDRVLVHVEKINSIPNLDSVEPTSHPLASEDIYRDDKVKEQATASELLKHAPDKHDGYFKVPRVIESN